MTAYYGLGAYRYFESFALTTEEIEQINQLQRPDGRVDGQDPKTYEEFE